MNDAKKVLGKSVAVVSGKGGSGKTLLVTAMGVELAQSGYSVVLIDADLGTGGLTYYLGFSAFSGARQGVADILRLESPKTRLDLSFPNAETERSLNIRHGGRLSLIPVGDHRGSLRSKEDYFENFDILRVEIDELRKEHDFIIVDCRGGVDSQSLEICSMVDDILMVVETDAASIKASQHLTDTLADRGLSSKVGGFVLNKVMDDPRTLANASRSFFSTQFLASVPFELETTRDFIRGFLPRSGSLFRKQVNLSLQKLFPELEVGRYSNYMSDHEFTILSTEPPEVKTGRTFVGIILALSILYYVFWTLVGSESLLYNYNLSDSELKIIGHLFFAIPALMTVIALSSSLLSAIGRIIRIYSRILRPFR